MPPSPGAGATTPSPLPSRRPRRPPRPIWARSRTTCSTHTAGLQEHTAALAADAEAYHALAEEAGFDYEQLLADNREEVAALIEKMQGTFQEANPAYEEMEGVVAGVPSLADFDVIIDAGADKSDPENAVPFSITTPGGKTYEQPGNFMFLTETSLWGTEEQFAAKGVEPDLDGDGKVEFGEALPDADFLVAAASDFAANAKELDAAAQEWEPTPEDAFTALVVMTPTMSEYFEAWKHSRFVAGDKAEETAFVAASRLQDIADILGGLVLVYDNVEPTIAEDDPAAGRADRHRAEGARAVRRRPARRGGRRARSSPPARPTRWARRRRTAPRRSPARSARPPGQLGHRAGDVAVARALAASLLASCACCVAGAGGRQAAPRAVARRRHGARRAVRRPDRADHRLRGGARRTRSRGRAPRIAGELRAGDPRRRPRRRRRGRGGAARGGAAAARRGDAVRLAAARGAARAAVLRGSFAATLAAVERGDAAAARDWLLLREFRTATRFTRPGANATIAVQQLERGRLDARRAYDAVDKDLLDAYQARLRELLDDAGVGAERDLPERRAEAAAQAAGYFEILAERYEEDRGAAARRAAPARRSRSWSPRRQPRAARPRRSRASPPRRSRPTRRPAAPSSCCASSRSCRSSTTAASATRA